MILWDTSVLGQAALENGHDYRGSAFTRPSARARTSRSRCAGRARDDRISSAVALNPLCHYLDLALKSDPFDRGNRYQRMLILDPAWEQDRG